MQKEEVKKGYKVIVKFKKGSGYKGGEQALENITEIHYNYPSILNEQPRIAFESDIDGSGVTYAVEDIEEFEAVLEDTKEVKPDTNTEFYKGELETFIAWAGMTEDENGYPLGDYDKALIKKVEQAIRSKDKPDTNIEKKCECCKWDDMGNMHEPYCPLFKKVDTNIEDWKEKLRETVVFTDGDGQGQATNITLEQELGEYGMGIVERKVQSLLEQEREKIKEKLMNIVFEYHDGDVIIRDLDITEWFKMQVEKII